MRLVDGDVCDFVKSGVPYVDERFGQANLLVGQVTSVTAEAPMQPRLLPVTFSDEVVFVGAAPATADQLADVQSALVESEASGRGIQSMAVSQWNNVPLQPRLNSIPFPSSYPTHYGAPMPNDMIALRARVQARIDTLESLDDKTPEMNATIKALKWVVEDIAKNTVSFTNADRTIP